MKALSLTAESRPADVVFIISVTDVHHHLVTKHPQGYQALTDALGISYGDLASDVLIEVRLVPTLDGKVGVREVHGVNHPENNTELGRMEVRGVLIGVFAALAATLPPPARSQA